MKSRNVVLCLAVVGLGTNVNVARAQNTLGELLDAGATKLTKEQVMDTVIGGTVSGPRPAGGSVETTYKANGEYSGNYNNPQGQGKAKQGGFFGKWTLDDNGKLCQEGTSALGQAVEACFFYFRGKDQLFVTVGSDSDRSAVALKRSVSR